MAGSKHIARGALVILATALAAPVLILFVAWRSVDGDILSHLATTLLPGYVTTSYGLMIGVALGTLGVGALSAWLVVMTEFPGRRLAAFALMLPLALPSYVTAYAYTDLLQVSGPLQTAIRDATGWLARDYWFPQIRSLEGAIFVLILCLYPYVYLATRATLMQQSVCVLEMGRTLGCSPFSAMLRLGLPLARPGLVAGVALVIMETLADYGAVSYFGLQTLTTAIYRSWFSLGRPEVAAQLSTVLLLSVALILWLDGKFRRGQRYFETSRRMREIARWKLRGHHALLAQIACFGPVVLGFVLPVGILIALVMDVDFDYAPAIGRLAGNSFTLGLATALAALIIGLIVNAAGRGLSTQSPLYARIRSLISFGYAIPGAVIAVGVLLLFGMIQQLGQALGLRGAMAAGSLVGLVFAYLVRFLSVSVRTIETGFQKMTPSMQSAARLLGASRPRTIVAVEAPLISASLASALLLVFVDVMKELPATLILRPFNFDTLAVAAYNYAADERLAEAALPSLWLVAIGLVPVVLLSGFVSRARAGEALRSLTGGHRRFRREQGLDHGQATPS